MVCADDYDIFAVSETWLSKDTSSDIVKISNYSFFRQDKGFSRCRCRNLY
nr:unnamed protein product [Callosobruchus analis]